VFNKSPCY